MRAPVCRVEVRQAESRRIPLATYRLQLHGGFGFGEALGIVGYLAELGISDVYSSPLFQAAPQSTHGYDVCGYDQVNRALGGAEGLERLSAALRQHQLGLLLDMVPNHMGNDLSNAWWLDVLENGRTSPYASWFDIDWEPLTPGLRNKVLLPALEGPYATVLESGKLKVLWEKDHLAVAYYERKFPASARSYLYFLQAMAWTLTSPLAEQARDFIQRKDAFDPSGDNHRKRFAELKAGLGRLHASSAEWRGRTEEVLHEMNGCPGAPRSFDPLHSFLEAQHYRLASWRLGPEIINYRRFFDVTELVSVRVENPEVFEASHKLVGDLIRRGQVTGLRIDHPDGLWNPRQYCERLQESFGKDAPLFVVVEKILTGDELLPADWPVDGTTGYDFLNHLNGIFVAREAETQFDRIYSGFAGRDTSFETAVYTCKEKVLCRSFVSEVSRLGRELEMLAAASRYTRDLPVSTLQSAVTEMLVAFPVYRTYATADATQISAAERGHVEAAVQAARHRKPGLDMACRFIGDLLMLTFPEDYSPAATSRAYEFVTRFQQLSGPVMAKGLEDTAFYNFNRLVCLNEVGGDPGRFGTTLEAFHAHNLTKQERWPYALLATATHDTKRGEDVRARINVLSELPEDWRLALERWAGLNVRHKTAVNNVPAPDRNDEYLLYQTLLGAWPDEAKTDMGLKAFRQRVSAFVLKAAKEAKAHTSWTEPNAEYEAALANFVEQILSRPKSAFLTDFLPLQQKVAWFGLFNSLSQVLLKFTCPGVPDVYQGTELWDLSLVDPDNRRPVDYPLRVALLEKLRTRLRSTPAEVVTAELLRDWSSGSIKLYLLSRLLAFRQANRALFQNGQYVPLAASGPGQGHLCVFARSAGENQVVVIAPRLTATLLRGRTTLPVGREIWSGTRVALTGLKTASRLRNVLTDQVIELAGDGQFEVADALRTLPVALLAMS